jgi:hypothetical protein
MHQNKLFLVFLVPTLLVGNLSAEKTVDEKVIIAEEKISKSWIEGEIEIRALSHYVDNGIELSKDPVVQSSITLTAGEDSIVKGLYLEIWHSAGTGNLNLTSDYADEIDSSVGWSGEIAKAFDIDIGVTHINIVKFDKSDGDILQPYAEVSKTFDFTDDAEGLPPCNAGLTRELRVFARHEISLPVNGNVDGTSSGQSTSLGLEFTFGITPELSIIQTGSLSRDDGIYGYTPALLVNSETKLEYQISEWVGLQVFFEAVGPVEQEAGDFKRKTRTTCGGGVVFKF